MGEPAQTTASFALGGGLPLVLARAVFVFALLSVGGVLVFRTLVLPSVRTSVAANTLRDADRAMAGLTWAALGVAAAAAGAWTLLQAADLADASQFRDAMSALGPVLGATQFGHLVLGQAFLLCVTSTLLLLSAVRGAAVAAMGNVAAQAGHGHAMAMVGVLGPLFWVDVLHLLAASAWIGGLLPLLIVVRVAPTRTAALAARWFSPLGKWSVAILAASAFIQGWWLVGSIRALVETPYGWMVLAKSACFGVLLGLAVLNRYRLAPALVGPAAAQSRRRLTGSLIAQTLAGLLAVLAAGVLSGLTPGMDMGMSS